MAVQAAGKTDREAFAAEPETTGKVKVASPQTGADYLASLADDREVYIYGERVADVTRHPAFRNTARMVARLSVSTCGRSGTMRGICWMAPNAAP